METNKRVPEEETMLGNTLTMEGKLGLNTVMLCLTIRDTSATSLISREKLPADTAGMLSVTFKLEVVAVFTNSFNIRAAVPISEFLSSRILHCNRPTAVDAVIDEGMFVKDTVMLKPWVGPDDGNKYRIDMGGGSKYETEPADKCKSPTLMNTRTPPAPLLLIGIGKETAPLIQVEQFPNRWYVALTSDDGSDPQFCSVTDTKQAATDAEGPKLSTKTENMEPPSTDAETDCICAIRGCEDEKTRT